MPQIHHVEESESEEWVLDPLRGPIKEKRRAMKPGSVERLVVPSSASRPDGETFELQPDGTFHVPQDVADFFTRMPGWHEGESPFPPPELVAEWEKRDPIISKAGSSES